MGRLRNGANTNSVGVQLLLLLCQSYLPPHPFLLIQLLGHPPPGPEFLLLTQPCMHWPQSSLWKDAHADTNTGHFQGYGPSGGLVAQEHHKLAVCSVLTWGGVTPTGWKLHRLCWPPHTWCHLLTTPLQALCSCKLCSCWLEHQTASPQTKAAPFAESKVISSQVANPFYNRNFNCLANPNFSSLSTLKSIPLAYTS